MENTETQKLRTFITTVVARTTMPGRYWWQSPVTATKLFQQILKAETAETAEALAVHKAFTEIRKTSPNDKVELSLVDAWDLTGRLDVSYSVRQNAAAVVSQ